MTILPSGTTAPHRRVRAGVRALVVAAVSALVLTLAPVSASAATPAPTPSPTSSAAPSGTTVFTLSPVGSGIVRAGEPLAVSLSLQNGTDAATAPVVVTLSLGQTALQGRTALSTWLAGDTSGVVLAEVGSGVLESAAAEDEQVSGIVVEPDNPALAGRAPGVYPLMASYESADGPVQSTSAMIVPDDGAQTVSLSVVVPITVGATAAGLLTATELTALTSPTGSLTSQLDAVEGTPAILAVDPSIVASISVLGSAAPKSATEWLARLRELPQSRFSLQFGDADVASQVGAGLGQPQQPTSFQYAMKAANFVPASNTPPTPVPTEGTDATPSASATPSATSVDPTTPVYPTLAELLDVGDAHAGVYWPATATPGVVSTLGDITVDDQPSVTLVPSTSTKAGATGQTVAAHARAGSADVLVYDTDISDALREASLIDETALRGASLTAATAYLTFAAAESQGAPVLVTLDRAVDRSRVGMRTAITAAYQAAGFTPLALDALLATTPASVEIADADAATAESTTERDAAASALFDDEAQIGRFATILDDPTLLTGPERNQILQVLSVAWVSDPEGWRTALAAHRAASATTLDSVGILPPTPINLFTAGAPLPVWVRNDLPYPVNVVLYATPNDLRLDVENGIVTVADPSGNTRVQVPVQARVGSGEVQVSLQLVSRTLEPIGDAQVADVSVRADWEGIGVVVLSVLIGGFVLLGIIRTVLKLRSRAKKKTADAADGAVDAGDTEGPEATTTSATSTSTTENEEAK